MALTPQLVAEIVRHRLGDEDGSRAARYMFLIPEALKLTGRKIAANGNLRHLLMTDKNAASVPLVTGGRVPIASLYSDHHILHEYLDYGQIYLAGEKYPLQVMDRQRAELPQYLGSYYRYYYLDGEFFVVKDAESGQIVSFSVPYYPATLADLPDSEEVEALFIAKLIELIVGQDAAEDGEK